MSVASSPPASSWASSSPSASSASASSPASSSSSSSLKVWFNGHACKTFPIEKKKTKEKEKEKSKKNKKKDGKDEDQAEEDESITCGTVRAWCAEELHIPKPIRSSFALYALRDGKEQELKDDDLIKDVRIKYGAGREGKGAWGESSADGFAYRVRDDAAKKIAGDSHTSPSSLPKEQQSIPSIKVDALEQNQQQDQAHRRGIGHQRSRSSPAVSTSELTKHLAMMEGADTVKLSSLHAASSSSTTSTSPRGLHAASPSSSTTSTSPRGAQGKSPTQASPSSSPHTEDSKGTQEKRSLTPTPSREQLEEKDEAKVLGSAPHLEPRTSSSPPRSTQRARSKTISSSSPFFGSKGQAPPPVAAAPLSLSSSSVTKPPLPPHVPQVDEALLAKGGSLGRSSARARGKRSSLNITSFTKDLEQNTSTGSTLPSTSTGSSVGRVRTSTSPPRSPRVIDSSPATINAINNSNSSVPVITRTRTSTSPPPPRQRFTPPPTVLAPLVATLATPPASSSPSPQASAPPAATAGPRQRAQTLGAKIFGVGKWVKGGNKETTTPAPAVDKKLEAVHEEEYNEKYLNELLSTTVNRLRKES